MYRPTFKVLLSCLLFIFFMTACAPAPTAAPQAPDATAAPVQTEAPAAELVKIKVSVLPFLSYAPLFIAQEEGFYAEQGFEVEFVRIDKTSEAMPALAQGQIDVASGFFDVSTLNAIAQGGTIKYVSDKGYLDKDGCGASTFGVRKDLIDKLNQDPKNIKGMKVAVTPTSAAEYALDLVLKEAGLEISDVEILNIPLPTRLEGMNNGSVDISTWSDPWMVRATAAGHSEWKPWQTIMPDFQFSVIMFGPNFLTKNPELGTKYLIAYLKGVRQYNQGKTARNIEIISKYTQVSPEEVEKSCWMVMRDDGMIDLNAPELIEFQEWAVAKGYQTAVVPVDQFIDLSFIKAANEALK